MSNLIVLSNQDQAKHFGSRRAMLMQCTEGARKGLLGVHKQGGRYTVPLPPGFNNKTEIFYKNGEVFVMCPGMKTVKCNFETGAATPVV